LTDTVGSVDRWFVGYLTLGTGEAIIGWTMFPSNTLLQDLPLVYDFHLATMEKMRFQKKKTLEKMKEEQ